MGSKRTLKENKSVNSSVNQQPSTNTTMDDKAEVVGTSSSIPSYSGGGDFPRGGSKGLSSIEYREVLRQADRDAQADNLFLAPVHKKPRTSVSSSTSVKKGSKSQDVGNVEEENDWIKSFGIKSLSVGTQLLGVITSFSFASMRIELPNLMFGTCDLTDISESYRTYLEDRQRMEDSGSIDEDSDFIKIDELFRAGQYVLCSVKELDVSSRPYKIKLTVDPSVTQSKVKQQDIQYGMTISAAIKSHEDHGAQLDLGIPNLTGFLPKAEMGEEALPIGSVVLATVQKSNSRVVTVSLVARSTQVKKPLSSIDSLFPGMLVEAKVSAIFKNGLGLLVLGFFEGQVEMMHLPASEMALLDRYPIGTTLQARVLLVSVTALCKTVQCSLLSHIIGLKNILPALDVSPKGHLFDQVEVIRAERLNGLVCHSEDSDVQLYAPLQQLEDGFPQADTLKKFKMGTLRPARVIGSFAIEGLLKVSLKPSICQEDYIMFETLQVGQRVKGTVAKIIPNSGIAVRLSEHITSAFIPIIHASDADMKDITLKYEVGQSVQCRVLKLDTEKNNVILTCKKMLLNPTLPLITSPEMATVGLVSHGMIQQVNSKGCLVQFWNNVVGFAISRELFSGPVEDPTKAFRVGQVVKCTVLSSSQGRISLSFRDLSKVDLTQPEMSIDGLKLGAITSGTVTSTTSDGLVLMLDSPKTNAFLSFQHLSDISGEHALHLARTYAVGTKIESLVILNYNPKEKIVNVSAKPLLLACMQSDSPLPLAIDEFHPGSVVPGFISTITEHGAYVGFVGRVSASVSAIHLPKKTTASVSKGQTVLAVVRKVEKETGKVIITLCEDEIKKALVKEVMLSKLICECSLPSYFSQVARYTKTSSNHVPGQLVTAVLSEKLAHGWSFKIGTVNGLMMLHHTRGLKAEVGASLDCRVLDVNIDGSLDLSLRKNLVDVHSITKLVNSIPPVEDQLLTQLAALTKRDAAVEAEVELVKRDYLIVSLPGFERSIAHVAAKTYNNQSRLSERFQCGELIKVRITLAQSGHARILATHAAHSKLTLKPQVTPVVTLQPGAVVQATLRKKLLPKNSLLYKLPESGLFATLHVTQIYDNYDSIPNKASPFENLVNVRFLECTVSELQVKRKAESIQLCALPSVMKSKTKTVEAREFHPGQTVLGFVKNASHRGLDILLTPKIKGHVAAIEVSSHMDITSNLEKLFPANMAVECRVLSVVPSLELTVTRANIQLPAGIDTYPLPLGDLAAYRPGCTVLAQVKESFFTSRRIVSVPLLLPAEVQAKASIHITQLGDDFENLPELSSSQFLTCTVIRVEDGHVHLSIRESRLHPESIHTIIDPEITKKSLSVGKVMRGFAIPDQETFQVALSDQLVASCSDICSDVKSIKLMQVEVTDVKKLQVKIHSIITTVFDFAPNSAIECRVAKALPTGLLVFPPNCEEPTFIHKSCIPILENVDSSEIVSVLSSQYRTNSHVIARALPSSGPDSRPRLTLRDTASDSDDSDDASEQDHIDESDDSSDEESEEEPMQRSASVSEESESEASDEDNLEILPLEVEDEFEWTSAKQPVSLRSQEESQEELKSKAPKSKSHKHALPEDLTAQTRAPEVASDFEKALLASPNSSLVWIQYMAYHLQMSALDKAREIAKRALATISLREEQERYNVFVAMLNLEFKFGDAASLDTVFQQARVMVNRPKHLHLQLAKLYQDGGFPDKAEATYLDIIKKFPQSAKAWAHLGEYYLDNGKLDQSRQTLQRSLKSLPKRKHLKAISQFAQLEFKRGEVERARTLFEGIVANYPKRLDLWSIYLDMESRLVRLGSQDADIPRRLFQRALKLKWSSRKMKFLFKKFLAFEQAHGLPHHVDHVKGLALAYVQDMAS